MEYEWLNMENALSEASTSYVFLSKLSKLSKLYLIFYYNAALFLLRQKPIFLIIHQSSCPACGYLKNVFNQSKELPIYAQDFVMVNLQVKKKGHFSILYFLVYKSSRHDCFYSKKDEEEPEDDQFDVDGRYFPRLFILGMWLHNICSDKVRSHLL